MKAYQNIQQFIQIWELLTVKEDEKSLINWCLQTTTDRHFPVRWLPCQKTELAEMLPDSFPSSSTPSLCGLHTKWASVMQHHQLLILNCIVYIRVTTSINLGHTSKIIFKLNNSTFSDNFSSKLNFSLLKTCLHPQLFHICLSVQ